MYPTGSSGPIYKTTYLNQEPPAVEQKGNQIVLNFSLTVPEAMFIAFTKTKIQSALHLGYDLISFSNIEQKSFNGWIIKTFPKAKYGSQELDQDTILANLWTKTKNFIENELSLSNDTIALQNEKEWHRFDDKNTEEWYPGHIGKLFTVRQAQLLLTAANNIGKA